MKFTKQFYLSWLLSSLAMFGLSYAWHGIFLNDFSHIEYSKGLFLSIAAIVYLIIGFAISQAVYLKRLMDTHAEKPIYRGFMVGIFAGIVFFLIALVIGISFTNQLKIKALLFDISWQIVEQSIGGVIVGLVHLFVYDPEAIQE
jgi:hypothetical protein